MIKIDYLQNQQLSLFSIFRYQPNTSTRKHLQIQQLGDRVKTNIEIFVSILS